MDIAQVRARIARALGIDERHVRVNITLDADNGVVVDATALLPAGEAVETR
jgi:hypothetical protein